MNHVHDSHETTPVEDAWYKLCIVAGKPLSDALGDYFGAVFKQIADQRIEHSTVNLDGKTICTYPVVPEGDVPEWFVHAIYEGTTTDVDHVKAKAIAWRAWTHGKARDLLEAELTRRVAEATADKDKRIAELEATNKSLLDGRREIRQELVEAKQRLAAATAEVSRLTKERTEVVRTLSELFKICAPQCTPLDYPMGLISQIDNYISGLIDERDRLRKRALPDGWEMSGSMIKRQDEIERLTKDNTKLREENARLSRPVSGSPEWTLAGQYIPDVPVVSYETLKIERNAREAAEKDYDELYRKHSEDSLLLDRAVQMRKDAEAERDELREFVAESCLTEEFAAHRAEKGKVQQ